MIDMLTRPVDEFYIGYEERMPAGIARRVLRGVLIFASSAAAGVTIALLAQASLPASRFEFGIVTPVEGVLRRDPYPSLEVNGSRVWLVGPGKFGADELLGQTRDGAVVVEGSAIERGATRMLEVTRFHVRSESLPNRFSAGPDSTPHDALREATVTGEVVDSKCFLGVMNPGEGPVHRDCARRCLSGGIPPMLTVRDGRGREELVLLVSGAGRPIGRELSSLAGRTVTVTGRLARVDGQYVLYADPSAYRGASPN
jgi:hypothetical protein